LYPRYIARRHSKQQNFSFWGSIALLAVAGGEEETSVNSISSLLFGTIICDTIAFVL
jgi:hypothetical protein